MNCNRLFTSENENPVLMLAQCETPKPCIVLKRKTLRKSLELIDYARHNSVVLISLPPHTSHELQLLDRSIFKPLEKHFNNGGLKWM